MKIIDTYPAMLAAYEQSVFNYDKWKSYIDSVLPGFSSLVVSDAKKCMETGDVSWERDYLPVINAVAHHAELRKRAHDSFCRATKDLDCTVYDRFGKDLDVDIFFYLGLCNGLDGSLTIAGER